MVDDVIKSYKLGEMAEKCDSIKAEATVADFIRTAREKNTEILPVLDDDNKVVGIVSEKDLIKLIKVEGVASNYPIIENRLPKGMLSEPITSIMTAEPVTLKETDSLESVINLILNHDFRRVIIVDAEKKLVGKIRIADMIYKLSRL